MACGLSLLLVSAAHAGYFDGADEVPSVEQPAGDCQVSAEDCSGDGCSGSCYSGCRSLCDSDLPECCDCFNGRQRLLGFLPSDHCFDRFISPLSNPFFFEDPRSLTEVRTLFIDNTLPRDNTGGGDVQVYGAGNSADALRIALL